MSRLKNTMLTCDILQQEAEVAAIADEWRQLHAECGKTPFSGYDFFDIWWRTLGRAIGRTLHIVTGRAAGQLVALLPLAVVPRKGFKVLQAVGAEGFYQCDMLSMDDAHAAMLWQAARRSRFYDFAHIRDVCPDSVCEHVLAAFGTLHDRNRAPFLRIEWSDRKAWEKTLPKRPHADVLRRARRLAEKGEVEYHVCLGEPVPDHVLRGLVQHKTAWCDKSGKQGMFDQPQILDFFRRLTAHAAQRGQLFLAWLTCGDSIVAYHLGLLWDDKLYSYVPAYDAAWIAYAPGHIMNINAIGWAIENGLKEYDQMHGDFAYKYQYSNGVRECKEFTFNQSAWGWVGSNLYIKRREAKEYLAKKRAAGSS